MALYLSYFLMATRLRIDCKLMFFIKSFIAHYIVIVIHNTHLCEEDILKIGYSLVLLKQKTI